VSVLCFLAANEVPEWHNKLILFHIFGLAIELCAEDFRLAETILKLEIWVFRSDRDNCSCFWLRL